MSKSRLTTTRKTTICFRTSEELQAALKRIGEQERRSVSSIIEHALFKYVLGREQVKHPQEERRRHPRKKVSAPALVRQAESDERGLVAAMVVDISLGGLQISVPSTFDVDVPEDKEQSRISVVFTLPEGNKPLTVECKPRHVAPHNGITMIGAAFTNADFDSYKIVQEYLIN